MPDYVLYHLFLQPSNIDHAFSPSTRSQPPSDSLLPSLPLFAPRVPPQPSPGSHKPQIHSLQTSSGISSTPHQPKACSRHTYARGIYVCKEGGIYGETSIHTWPTSIQGRPCLFLTSFYR